MKLNLLYEAKAFGRFVKHRMPGAIRRKNLLNANLALKEIRIKKIINSIYGDGDLKVLTGPFKGMNYIRDANGSQLLPKLIGSYEEPLHNWIIKIIDDYDYSSIVDVGCAEGYYAIGLAKAKSTPKVYGFDIDKAAITNAKLLAKLNNVDEQVKFYESFNSEMLDKIFDEDPIKNILVFMDVEGAEEHLLNPEKISKINECDILVELHDCFYPQLTEKIIGYFRKTHEIKIIVDYPWRKKLSSEILEKLSIDDLNFATDEVRPPAMRWMYAKKK